MQLVLIDENKRYVTWIDGLRTDLGIAPGDYIPVADPNFLASMSSKLQLSCAHKAHIWQSASEILLSVIGYETQEHDFAIAAALVCLESLERLDALLAGKNNAASLLILSQVTEQICAYLKRHKRHLHIERDEELYRRLLAPALAAGLPGELAA